MLAHDEIRNVGGFERGSQEHEFQIVDRVTYRNHWLSNYMQDASAYSTFIGDGISLLRLAPPLAGFAAYLGD